MTKKQKKDAETGSPVEMTPSSTLEPPATVTAEQLDDLKARLVDLVDSKFTEASAFTQLVNDALIERLVDAEARLSTLEAHTEAGAARYPAGVTDYKVKPGDTLVLIAKKQLGNPGHFSNIATINYDRYPTLRTSQAVEVGWVLRLPPR